LILRPVLIASLILLLLSATVGIASAQLSARVETPYAPCGAPPGASPTAPGVWPQPPARRLRHAPSRQSICRGPDRHCPIGYIN
jgi:hypothetical protein